MARLRFTLGTRYLTCGDIYLVRHILPDARVVVENQTSGGQDTVALSDLIATWAAGALTFEVRDPHPPSHETSSRPIAPTIADLQGVEPAHRDEAWRRYTLIQPLLTLPSVERTRQALETYAASVRAEDDASVSRASLQRWLRAFTEGGHDIRALVPAASRSGGRGQSRLTAETEAIVRAVLAACAAAPHYRTGFDVYLLVLNRVAEANRDRPPATRLTPPSPRTIYRRIAYVGEPTILRRIGRVERQATRPVGSGPAPTRVLERVEIDHTPLDVILALSTRRIGGPSGARR